MSQLRFYLDGNLQTSEDIDYRDARIGLRHASDYNALYRQYVTTLRFEGDAYTFMASQMIAKGICGEVHLKIDYQCADFKAYDSLFEGYMKFRSISIDQTNCVMTVNAEDNTLISTLLKNDDAQVKIDTTKTLLGSTITPPAVRTLGLWDETGGAFATRKGYFCYDILEYLIKYTTNNSVAITSTFFQSTTTQRYIKVLKFLVPAQIATGTGSLIVVYNNYFNQTITKTFPIQATAAGTLNRLLFELRGDAAATNRFEEYYQNDHIMCSEMVSNGVDSITFTNDFDFTVSIGNNSGISWQFITTQTGITRGGQRLSISTGHQLRNATIPPPQIVPTFSFKSFYQELNKLYNLGFSLTIINGVPTLQVEPIDFFILQSLSTVSLAEVAQLEYKIGDRFAIDIFSTGDASKDDQYRGVVNSKDTWQSASKCDKVKRVIKSDWITDWQKIIAQRTTTDDANDEKIYVMEMMSPINPTDADARLFEDRTYTNALGANLLGYTMNNNINNYGRLRNWLFSATADLVLGDKRITNASIPKLLRSYTFQHPVSYSQMKTLISTPFAGIMFGEESNPQRTGWQDGFESNLLTGQTDFVLLTQNQ